MGTEGKSRETSLEEIYAAMELLPLQLTEVIENYASKIRDENKRTEDEEAELNRERNSKANDSVNGTKQQKEQNQAERAAKVQERETIRKRLSEISDSMAQANDKYLECGDLLHHKNARGRQYTQIVQIMQQHDKILDAFEALKESVKDDLQGMVNERYFQEKGLEADRAYNATNAQIMAEYIKKKNQEETRHTQLLSDIRKNFEKQVENFHSKTIRADIEKCQLQIPLNQQMELVKEMPETVHLAVSALELSKFKGDSMTAAAVEMLAKEFDFCAEMRKGRKYLTFPYGQSFASETFNKIIEYDFESREMALEYLAAIEMRLFQSIPAGKLRVTMFDPLDLGKNFAMFSVLGEHDERIISTKIWHETDRMKEKLEELVSQISHVTQDCLKGVYPNIVEYNKVVGKNAEPLHVLFIADFAKQNFDMEACRLLQQILSSGPECGVFCFVSGNHNSLELGLGSDALAKNDRFIFEHGRMKMKHNGRKDIDMLPIKLPDVSERTEILQKLNEGIKKSERIIIDYNEVSDNLLDHKEKWFQYLPDESGISIPVGLEGANKVVEIGFGGIHRTQHHMLISGTIGSGKSTFLHSFIISTILHYGPEDVQIYLLDFKKGVEFKVYSEYNLPNFKVISTDTTPEYGLAVLKYLCEEHARIESSLFKKNGLSLIEEYNDKYPNQKIGRTILIMDEFHEMFVDSDTDTAKECFKYLQQLVKQGRAWGVYVVLASQKLPESCRDIYHQMLNRVALQSTEEVAKMILDADNPGIPMLANMDVGSGIFNDNGGDKDSNRIFRIAYFNRESLKATLKQIEERQQELEYDRNLDDSPMILDINNLSDAKDHPLTAFTEEGRLPEEKQLGCPLYFAKSLTLDEQFEMRLYSDEAQNLLIAGPEDGRVKRILGISAMSILFNAIVMNDGILPDKPIITYFDFSNGHKNFASYDILNELAACYPQQIRVFGKSTVMFGLEQMEKEIEEGIHERHFVIFAGLNRAKKILSHSTTYEKSPRERLIQMVEAGPEKGVNFIIWANEPESFLEFYPEMLDWFDYRIGYELQDDALKKMFLNVNMEFGDDNTAISYSADADNMKIRIYDAPLKEYVDKFIDQVDKCLIEEPEFEE